MSFRNYRLQNRCLCKGLKSDLSVYPGTINMLKGRKYCCNLHDVVLSDLFITLGKFQLEKVLLSII